MCFTMQDAKHVVETIDALLTGMYALVLKGTLFFVSRWPIRNTCHHNLGHYMQEKVINYISHRLSKLLFLIPIVIDK